MANLVSNYKNFKGESAPAKMAILDGTSTLNVPIPTASFSSSHREQNAPFSAFQKQRGQDISPVPLCFFSLFLFKQKKREPETKQKSLSFVVPDFQKKKGKKPEKH